ncbi:DAK2 domain-containing protein [Mycoplasma sp. ATU-Cv-508]|uniref:DAK2 domain-containing protein n=1 Tax=Mycoplasma sp. ATU-Cv-508 TaxID=2048001 RepID=UPI000FDE01B4
MSQLSAAQFKKALISGASALINSRDKIDALNVFPVPDGDTGSNMAGTIKSGLGEIENQDFKSIGELTKRFARGALLGARGNSGVILSQIFKGISVALDGVESATNFQIVEAFIQAQKHAYKSVMKPVEGTMLTIIRMVAEHLEKTVTHSHNFVQIFQSAVQEARRACDLTPNLLAILKEVGVTDSGGEGLVLILTGILRALEGKPVALQSKNWDQATTSNEFLHGANQVYEGEFGYCTECVIELEKPESFDKRAFENGLGKLGDSIVVVHDEEIVKVHVHTPTPGNVFNYAQRWGEFLRLKSENMTLQANLSQGQKSHAPSQLAQEELPAHQAIEVISCNDGHGIIAEMKNLGAHVIEGGQTNNPSTRDFLAAIDQIKAQNIIILPNNSNIILVAQQVIQTIRDKKIIIIPTKTQMEGITAMINFDKTNTLEENQELMLEGVEEVLTGQVSIAIKDSKLNKVTIKKGQYLAIAERKVVASVKSKVEAACRVVDKLVSDDTEIITIWYGADATEADAQEVSVYVESKYNAVVEIKKGGQRIYDFLISFE